MRPARLLHTLIVALFAAAIPAASSGQDASPVPAGVTSELLFEITVPPEDMPSELLFLNYEEHRIAPGTDVTVLADESHRGNAQYVHAGMVIIEPFTESMVWRGEKALGGEPEVIEAGQPVELQIGDLLFTPGLPIDAIDPEAEIRFANPGTEETLLAGFHLHETFGPTSPGDPEGITSFFSRYTFSEGIGQMQSDGATFRMTRITADPDTVVSPPEEALAVYYQVMDGRAKWTMTGPSGETSSRWPAGRGGWLEIQPSLQHDVLVTSDTPASLIELAVFPVESDSND